MFVDRLICRIFGHSPWVARPGTCSRCGAALPAPAPLDQAVRGAVIEYAYGTPAASFTPCGTQRGSMLPWWMASGPTPPGWVEPTTSSLIEGRWKGRAEYMAAWTRINLRNKGGS